MTKTKDKSLELDFVGHYTLSQKRPWAILSHFNGNLFHKKKVADDTIRTRANFRA